MRVVIPSDSSMLKYPDNTLTTFTLELTPAIELPPGQWEVGLSEIQFFKSWFNTPASWIEVKQGDDVHHINIPGFYSKSIESFVDILNYEIDKQVKGIKVLYNNVSRRITIQVLTGLGIIIKMKKNSV